MSEIREVNCLQGSCCLSEKVSNYVVINQVFRFCSSSRVTLLCYYFILLMKIPRLFLKFFRYLKNATSQRFLLENYRHKRTRFRRWWLEKHLKVRTTNGRSRKGNSKLSKLLFKACMWMSTTIYQKIEDNNINLEWCLNKRWSGWFLTKPVYVKVF